MLSDATARLFYGWQAFLRKMFTDFHHDLIEAPLFISWDLLKLTKYAAHFPQQLFEVQDHARHRHPPTHCVSPAACLHLYPMLRDREVKRYSALVAAHCARYESGNWRPPYRLPDFHMIELVVVGSEALLSQDLLEVERRLVSTFAALQIDGKFQAATDAFFLGNDEGARVVQKLKGLKKEFVVRSNGEAIALASINNHEDFFAKIFGIASGDKPAHSFCVAFGLERLAFYSVSCWGKDEERWPKEFREHGQIP